VGAFGDLHRDRIAGSLAMFDRMIFKGHLSRLYKQDGSGCFVWSQGVRLKGFTAYAKATTERIANNARKLVADAGRLVISFDHVKTRNRIQHNDDLPSRSPNATGSPRDHLSDLGGGVVFQLPGPQAQRDRQARVVPPGTQVSAPLPVGDRPRVRVDAGAHPGVDPL
jgi:hypothetical protein